MFGAVLSGVDFLVDLTSRVRHNITIEVSFYIGKKQKTEKSSD